MGTRLLLGILRIRRELRSHERWSRAQLQAFQKARLAELRRYAYAHSPFYQRSHRGLEASPLADLPVLTKAELMTAFDDLVTAREVRRADIEEHLAKLQGNERFLNRFWVSRTSGSTGHPGLFLVDRHEWAMVIASYARAQEWAGVKTSLFRRTRLSVVSSRVPWHQVTRTKLGKAPLIKALRPTQEVNQ